MQTTSHVFVNKYWSKVSRDHAQSVAWACARMHARIQPQLFCYFPLQHLVLISFLMRLWLRPIRANYQRRSGVGCMPTMTPVPREKPGWKRPQHFSFCTSFQSKKIEHHTRSCKLYSALQYMKTSVHNREGLYTATHLVIQSVLTSCRWMTVEIQNGVLPFCPLRRTKTRPLMQSLMETLQSIERDYQLRMRL